MRKILSLFIVSINCCLLASGCYSQPSYLEYPRVDMVYTTFFNNYSVHDIPSVQLLQFQKKPDGWHVVLFKTDLDTIAKDELIWSRKNKSFQKINFPAISYTGENKDNLASYRQSFNNYYFNLFPYYNYRGFDWDMIQDYGNAKNLPDSILYALGRSYSYFADNLLNNNSGLSDKRFRFILKDGPNCLSQEQLDKYRKYHNLAIETFKTVQKINPNYVTMVGDIGVKLADEYMVGYLDMLIYQNNEEANKELPDGIYDNFMIANSKNYLASCDSNAILVTFGDNDTYPLLYVQAKDKFRTDVLIVNNELISLPRYINRMRRPFIGAQPLQLSISPDQYKEGTRDYLFYYNRQNGQYSEHSYTDLKEIMDFILSDDTAQKLQMTDAEWLNYFPVNTFKLAVNKANVSKSRIISPDEAINMEDALRWKFTGSYMLKGKLILLNALLNNDWKRPICFTNGGDGEYLGLENYLRLQGLVYELVPLKNHKPAELLNPLISTGEMYDLIMHKFEWGGLNSGKKLCEGEVMMANNIRSSVSKLASALMDENKKDSALKVLDLCMDSIPESNCPYDFTLKYMDQTYYRVGAFTRANSISKKLFKTFEDQLIKYSKVVSDNNNSNVPPTGYVTTDAMVEEAKIALKDITRFAKYYNQDALYKEYISRLNALAYKGLMSQDDIDSISAN